VMESSRRGPMKYQTAISRCRSGPHFGDVLQASMAAFKNVGHCKSASPGNLSFVSRDA
jgi:hypothetical protein